MAHHYRTERGYIYLYMNEKDHFVISSGIEFSDFIKGVPINLHNLLLIRHGYEDGHFNMRTMLDFADADMIGKLASQENPREYGDFCWLDFEDEEQLNLLSGQEIAEILYLGHLKEHLKLPFYNKLNNQFVYLAGDDGHDNKTYYKSWEDFYSLLGNVIAHKVNNPKEVPFFSRWRKKNVPPISANVLASLKDLFKEGFIIAPEKANRSRQMSDIPFWILGDYFDMDAMIEEYEHGLDQKSPDGRFVFDRKTGEWDVSLKAASAQ